MTMIRRMTIAVVFSSGLALGLIGEFLASCAAPARLDRSGGSKDLQNAGPKYDYLHFMAGECMEKGKRGQGVIDLRNGRGYCVPWDGSVPMQVGALDLAAISIN